MTKKFIPQTLRGASSSRRMGWLTKISRAAMQRPLISASVRLTCLPGLEALTSRSLSRSLSTSISVGFGVGLVAVVLEEAIGWGEGKIICYLKWGKIQILFLYQIIFLPKKIFLNCSFVNFWMLKCIDEHLLKWDVFFIQGENKKNSSYHVKFYRQKKFFSFTFKSL